MHLIRYDVTTSSETNTHLRRCIRPIMTHKTPDEFHASDEFTLFHTLHNRRIKSTKLNSSELNATIVRRIKRP